MPKYQIFKRMYEIVHTLNFFKDDEECSLFKELNALVDELKNYGNYSTSIAYYPDEYCQATVSQCDINGFVIEQINLNFYEYYPCE